MLQLLVTLQTLVSDRFDRKDDEGATMVEYGLMAALIAVVCLAAVALIGTNLDAQFDKIGEQLKSAK